METDDLDRDAAAAELAALQADRDALAARAVQPWWYDALLGLLLFAFISSYSLHNTWITLAALAVFLLCLRGMMALYRRLTGFWVDGFRRGRHDGLSWCGSSSSWWSWGSASSSSPTGAVRWWSPARCSGSAWSW